MTNTLAFLIALFGVTTTACGGSQAATEAPPQPANETSAASAHAEDCPFGARDVQLALANTDGGAILTATGPSERVAALRAMAQRMAAMHREHAARGEGHGMHHEGGMHEGGMHEGGMHEGGMHEGGMHEGGMHEGGMMKMPSAEISVEEIEGGVRMTIEATTADQVGALQAHLEEQVAMMKKGMCHAGAASADSSDPAPSSGHQH